MYSVVMVPGPPFQELLPSHDYSELERLPEIEVFRRRERVFLILSGVFLGTLAMLNIIGITRFVDL